MQTAISTSIDDLESGFIAQKFINIRTELWLPVVTTIARIAYPVMAGNQIGLGKDTSHGLEERRNEVKKRLI